MESKAFSPCPYCDGRDDNCADCELQAYRALGTIKELDALDKARDEGRVLPEKSMWTATCHGSKLVLILDVKAAQEAEAALQKGGPHEANPV